MTVSSKISEKEDVDQSLERVMLRPTVLRNYLAIFEGLGYSERSLLEGTGIDPDVLRRPDCLIEAAACEKMISNFILKTGKPGIGLEIGGKSDLAAFGILAYALTTSRVLRETVPIWRQYSKALLGIVSCIEEGVDAEGNLTLTLSAPSESSPIFVFCVEEFFAMICKHGYAMSGIPHQFVRMELPYPEPAYSVRYRELFGCPIEFDAALARVTLAKSWVDRPVLAKDDNFHRICVAHCGRILLEIEQRSSVSIRIRRLFLGAPRSIPSLKAAANSLGMSARTLRRKLQEEGHSYHALVRSFRADLAREYLTSTQLSAKEIADLLGFDDVHYFRQCFKQWTGHTVNSYRTAQKRAEET